MWLNATDFRQVIHCAPLVSIDLVVLNECNEVLLGKRVNRPAMGFWFVPGGRIQKNETLDQAFRRLTNEELGMDLGIDDAKPLGTYEHFYADSVFGEADSGPNTHYVVLAHHLPTLSISDMVLPLTQHSHYQWWPLDKALHSSEVHPNTKAYLPDLLRNF